MNPTDTTLQSVLALMTHQPTTWLEYLQTELAIKVTTAQTEDGRTLASLKYDQIESPMTHPIVRQCRGMVVDVTRRKILAHPYDKFWNLGDAPAAVIDWSTARVLEKLDGSLMILYWDDFAGQWRVASSGTPLAGGSYGASSDTFGDVFWRTFIALNMHVPDADLADLCFMFELCAPDNRIVVRYEEPRIVLHGARDMYAGREVCRATLVECAIDYNWEIVQTYPIESAAHAVERAANLDPIATEGFVVVDAEYNRVKIKSPRYVALHHMKGEATPRRAVELWQAGPSEIEELLGYFPEMRGAIEPVVSKLEEAVSVAWENYLLHRYAPTRKDYALAVKDARWATIAFQLYGRDATDGLTIDDARSIARGLSTPALERMVF